VVVVHMECSCCKGDKLSASSFLYHFIYTWRTLFAVAMALSKVTRIQGAGEACPIARPIPAKDDTAG